MTSQSCWLTGSRVGLLARCVASNSAGLRLPRGLKRGAPPIRIGARVGRCGMCLAGRAGRLSRAALAEREAPRVAGHDRRLRLHNPTPHLRLDHGEGRPRAIARPPQEHRHDGGHGHGGDGRPWVRRPRSCGGRRPAGVAPHGAGRRQASTDNGCRRGRRRGHGIGCAKFMRRRVASASEKSLGWPPSVSCAKFANTCSDRGHMATLDHPGDTDGHHPWHNLSNVRCWCCFHRSLCALCSSSPKGAADQNACASNPTALLRVHREPTSRFADKPGATHAPAHTRTHHPMTREDAWLAELLLRGVEGYRRACAGVRRILG